MTHEDREDEFEQWGHTAANRIMELVDPGWDIDTFHDVVNFLKEERRKIEKALKPTKIIKATHRWGEGYYTTRYFTDAESAEKWRQELALKHGWPWFTDRRPIPKDLKKRADVLFKYLNDNCYGYFGTDEIEVESL